MHKNTKTTRKLPFGTFTTTTMTDDNVALSPHNNIHKLNITNRSQALSILGLNNDECDLKRIRHQFKCLALSLHPDRQQRNKNIITSTNTSTATAISTIATDFHQIQQAFDFLLHRNMAGSRTLYKVAHGGQSISAVGEDVQSVEVGMGLGDEEESVTATVTFTTCPLCLKPFKIGRALRAHFQSSSHSLTATSTPLTLEGAINLALANFTITATSNYMVTQASASVGLVTKGRPMLLDCCPSSRNTTAVSATGKCQQNASQSIALERARERACTKASAAAASASVRTWCNGAGNRADAKLSHAGLTASRDGDLDELRRLIKSGEYDTCRDTGPNGETGLHWAAGSGHLDVLIFLVNVDGGGIERLLARDTRSGRNCIHWAARNGHRTLLEEMETRWANSTSSMDNGCDVHSKQQEHQLDFDCLTFDGTTPLQLACYAGEMNAVSFLVERGCLPNWKNNYGCNSLFFACIGGQYIVCKHLYEECSVDAFAIQNQGHSALHKAAYTGSHEICTWLQDVVGLDKQCLLEDAKGHRANDLARMKGHVDLGKYLTRFREA